MPADVLLCNGVAACSVEEWLFSATPPPAACQGGSAAGQVDEQEVLSVWMQMVNAVHRCHLHGVVHKDIKLPNFLMDSRGRVQIMDFGLAQLEGVTPRAVAGTPWTMSPAGFKHGDDGRSGDWWSLGVVLYQLLQGGAWPFKHCWWPWQRRGGAAMEAAIRRAVLAGHITFSSGPGGATRRVSEPIKALIRGLLQPDPNRRWQLRQVLASPAVAPELLSGLAARFPELGRDMEELLAIQRRARGLRALRSDGGSSGGGAAAAGEAEGGVAGVERVARGVAAAVAAAAEGGLHWPHWAGAGGRGHAAADGAGGSAYEPLLAEAGGVDGGGDDGDGGGALAAATHGAAPSSAGAFRAGRAYGGLMRHSLTTPSLGGALSNASGEAHDAGSSAAGLDASGSLPPGLSHSMTNGDALGGATSPRHLPRSHHKHPRVAPDGVRGSRTSLEDLFGARAVLSGALPHRPGVRYALYDGDEYDSLSGS
ncbi:hypothetical protein GPECTOR_3g447 [Gonium pectorale]|uniref:Protein kinase domain-containing protein n=1 Tax=Gonium pectorale TaxID=33097 RepID=A0A150GZY3_GONPE|nr:hypothetical protein GPECTOR_3g447 [Gonium pectorale]|eukprot:KXZ55313.1 hypothetical protein GPECTOR_3g447 [Gonium pectorale]